MSTIKIVSIKKGHSLFDFIAEHVKGEVSGLSPNRAFHRLCSLMRKMKAHTVVIEQIDKSFNEVNKEYNALISYYEKDIEFEALRFTFILDEIDEIGKLKILDDDKFLASAIVINFNKVEDPVRINEGKGWYSYLYSAFVTIPKINGTIPLLNNYLHVYRQFNREVLYSDGRPPKQYKITGTFFSEQNAVTSVCAHASLCMILNNMEGTNDILVPEDINKIVGINHAEKKEKDRLARDGLNQDDINNVLISKGLTYKLLNFFSNPNIDYDAQIYNYLESRFPCLLVFTTKGQESHIVPILGHTLNSDIWKPEATVAYAHESAFDGYLSAVRWIDHFIIHDDNFGMYNCLPVDTLKKITLPKHDPYFRAAYAIAVVPADVTTSAREAEWASIFITTDILEWRISTGSPLDFWCKQLPKGIVTIRTFNISKEGYVESLKEKDFNGNSFSDEDKKNLTEDLPARFWLSEITLPDLYSANKHKIIDFFYRSDCPDDIQTQTDVMMRSRWLQIRFPYMLVKRTSDGNVSHSPLSVKSHYPLLPHSAESNKVEW